MDMQVRVVLYDTSSCITTCTPSGVVLNAEFSYNNAVSLCQVTIVRMTLMNVSCCVHVSMASVKTPMAATSVTADLASQVITATWNSMSVSPGHVTMLALASTASTDILACAHLGTPVLTAMWISMSVRALLARTTPLATTTLLPSRVSADPGSLMSCAPPILMSVRYALFLV